MKLKLAKSKDEKKAGNLELKHAVKNRKYKEVFFSEVLSAGTAVIVGRDANDRVKHGVPTMMKQEGQEGHHVSGSIVGRCISTVIPWEEVGKKVRKRKRCD